MQPQNKILIRPLNHTHTHIYAYSQPQTHAKCSVFASTRTAATAAAAAAQSTLSLLRRGACVFVCVAGRRVNALHREVQGWTNQSFAQRVHDHGVRAYKHTIAQIYICIYAYVCVCGTVREWPACIHTHIITDACVTTYIPYAPSLYAFIYMYICMYVHIYMYVCVHTPTDIYE